MEKVVAFVEHLIETAVAKAKEAIAPDLADIKARLSALEAKAAPDLEAIADGLDKALPTSAAPVVSGTSDPVAAAQPAAAQ